MEHKGELTLALSAAIVESVPERMGEMRALDFAHIEIGFLPKRADLTQCLEALAPESWGVHSPLVRQGEALRLCSGSEVAERSLNAFSREAEHLKSSGAQYALIHFPARHEHPSPGEYAKAVRRLEHLQNETGLPIVVEPKVSRGDADGMGDLLLDPTKLPETLALCVDVGDLALAARLLRRPLPWAVERLQGRASYIHAHGVALRSLIGGWSWLPPEARPGSVPFGWNDLGLRTVDYMNVASTATRVVLEVDSRYVAQMPGSALRFEAALRALGWHLLRWQHRSATREVGPGPKALD